MYLIQVPGEEEEEEEGELFEEGCISGEGEETDIKEEVRETRSAKESECGTHSVSVSETTSLQK